LEDYFEEENWINVVGTGEVSKEIIEIC